MAGVYNIGSSKGKQIANNLKAGGTYKASDGSTWKKNNDGSLSVTTKSGNTLAGKVGGTTPTTSTPSLGSGGSGKSSSSGGSSKSAGNVSQPTSTVATPNPIAKPGNVATSKPNTTNASAITTNDKAASLYGLVSGNVASGNGESKDASGKTTNLSDAEKMAANSKAWHTADAETRKKLEDDNQVLGKKLGLSYNSAAGTWAQPAANVNAATPNNNAATAASPKATTYTDANDKAQTGYNIGGKIYQDAAGTKRIGAGSVVGIGDKKYLMTADGNGLDITTATPSRVYQVDPTTGKVDTSKSLKTLVNVNGTNYDLATGQVYRTVASNGEVIQTANQRYYDALTGEDLTDTLNAVNALPPEMPLVSEYPEINELAKQVYNIANDAIKADPTLTWEQALGKATEQLNGSYNAAATTALEEMDRNALKSGFFGQLPTEALKRNTASSIEVQKQQAINELATQLHNQSIEQANNTLANATEAQQNKIATMLNLLGVAASERDTANKQAMNEAQLTGTYKGKSTLDFLNYLLDKSTTEASIKAGKTIN